MRMVEGFDGFFALGKDFWPTDWRDLVQPDTPYRCRLCGETMKLKQTATHLRKEHNAKLKVRNFTIPKKKEVEAK